MTTPRPGRSSGDSSRSSARKRLVIARRRLRLLPFAFMVAPAVLTFYGPAVLREWNDFSDPSGAAPEVLRSPAVLALMAAITLYGVVQAFRQVVLRLPVVWVQGGVLHLDRGLYTARLGPHDIARVGLGVEFQDPVGVRPAWSVLGLLGRSSEPVDETLTLVCRGRLLPWSVMKIHARDVTTGLRSVAELIELFRSGDTSTEVPDTAPATTDPPQEGPSGRRGR